MYKCPVDDVGQARDGGGQLCINVLSTMWVMQEMEEHNYV